MTILSKGHKPNNFEWQNSLELSFTNIQGFQSNFPKSESFLQSRSPDILALSEANLGDSTEPGSFSVGSYLSLNWKDFVTHFHDFIVYVKKWLPVAKEFYLENSADFYLCFQLASPGFFNLSVLLFFIYQSPSLSLCKVFRAISI